jgi:hypothetical protein
VKLKWQQLTKERLVGHGIHGINEIDTEWISAVPTRFVFLDLSFRGLPFHSVAYDS